MHVRCLLQVIIRGLSGFAYKHRLLCGQGNVRDVFRKEKKKYISFKGTMMLFFFWHNQVTDNAFFMGYETLSHEQCKT